jgi:hypothetical protein
MDAAAEWTEWLSSTDCRQTLVGAAQFIYRQAVRLRLPFDLLPCTNPWSLPADERADCFEMLADELWIFLRSRPADWPLKSQWAILSSRGGRFLMLKIAQDFLHHLRDKARTYSYDPVRALYRRLRQVLHQEEGVVCHATVRGSFYSLDPQADPEDPMPPPEAEAYSQWNSPVALVALKDLEKKTSLVVLARFFWEEAHHRFGRASFLPVRELVRYIRTHYALPLPMTAVASTAGDDESPQPQAMNIDDPEERCSGEASFVGRNLENLARQLAASWSARQRAVFSLIHGDGHTLAEAARQLGYRSAAGADYVYKSSLHILRDFCLLWPGLSPPELDKRLFEAFVLHLVEICKTGF